LVTCNQPGNIFDMLGQDQSQFNLILCLHALGIHELFSKAPNFFRGHGQALSKSLPAACFHQGSKSPRLVSITKYSPFF
jgi:hypothetical protein